MSLESERAAAKFIRGVAGNSPRTRIGVENIGGYVYSDYGSRILNDGTRIYSYGQHFLIAERDDTRGGYWVTEGRYQTGEWKSGKPKFSPTTDKHVRDVRTLVERVADKTSIIRLGWENMPRFTEPYPMRFYWDRAIGY